MIRVRVAGDGDLDFLAAADLELPEELLRKKVVAGEILVAHLWTLSPLDSRTPSPGEDGQGLGVMTSVSAAPFRPLLQQPTPTSHPSVDIELLSQQTASFEPDSPGVSAAPSLRVPSPISINPHPVPTLHEQPNSPPTHSIAASEPIGFLRFGYLFDSQPFIYASSALPSQGFSRTQILSRLIDHFELSNRAAGFSSILASVEQLPDGVERTEFEHLLVKMAYVPAGEIAFPHGGKERVYSKPLIDREGVVAVRNPGALSY